MLFFLALLVLIVVFLPWFTFEGTLSSGDWPYLFVENIEEFSFSPEARFLWLAVYYQIPTKLFVDYLNLPWELAERILWFWPFLILSILSSYYLTKSWIGVLLYTANTYILMVVGGGQMGIAMAYSITPFVLKSFMNLIDLLSLSSKNFKFQISNFKFTLLAGLVFSILTIFDPRIAYVTMIAIILCAALNIQFTRENKRYTLDTVFYVFLIPLAITFVLNAYWIIPIFIGGIPQEHKGLESVAGFEFLSFADFSHAFSLLHPNWPENFFGKTYFLQPEFLLLPILAYSSLLFISNIKNQKFYSSSERSESRSLQDSSRQARTILYFCLMGLLGAFLAKGGNEPFGFLNQWIFQYVPGMNMFRDPTKFYILVALSYSVLIPFGINSIYRWINAKLKVQSAKLQFKVKSYIPNLFLIFTILYLIFLIRPAIFGELSGTFKPQPVPREYILLKNFIVRQEDSFNTLWIPRVQRYGFDSKRYQAISADRLLGASSIPAVLKEFQEPGIEQTIKNLDIKYIIVPFDSQKDIFLKDRKYDPHLYNSTVAVLQKLVWIEKDNSFGNIIVFRVL